MRHTGRYRVLGLAIALGCLILLPGGCSTAQPHPAGSRIPVAVDTDLGADDILALLYLLGRTDVDIVAVSVVGDGLVHCPDGAVNARAVLTAAERSEIPVACGSEVPVTGSAAFPADWRTQADQLYGMAASWPAPQAATTTDSESLLVQAATRHPGLFVLALGPLTNVAKALRHADVVASQPHVIVSGGAVGEPGNMPSPAGPVAEWNIGVDPAAADEVLHARVPTEWVALDATNDVPADIWFSQALAGQARSRAGELALSFLRANAALTRGGFYFWDPLAAVAITDPQTVTNRIVRMSVTTSGAQSGRTAIDQAGPEVSVAVKADPATFAGAMLQAFSPPGSPPGRYVQGQTAMRVLRSADGFRLEMPTTTLPATDTVMSFDAAATDPYAVIVGRIAPGHTFADVAASAAQRVTSVPSWFIIEATVEVPAGSRPTWLVYLPTGNHAVVAANADGSGLTALGGFTTS